MLVFIKKWLLGGLGIGVLLASGLVSAASASASTLPEPRERVVLTVSGQIGLGNRSAQMAAFDLAMLEALPQHSFATRTPWHEGVVRFSGPLLRDVLARVQAQGQTLRATALNDYRISIPTQDARDFDVIVATRLNGEPMPVRTHGPLFIVYPFDTKPQLQSARFYERSIWQLRSLEVIE